MSRTFLRLLCILALPLSLSGCLGTIVGTAVDVGIEVVKIPFKVGKAVVDVATDDSDSKKTEQKDDKPEESK
ncbi:NF038104 family lipoprotein [Uliginosibacterium gangwonense]|uniref:NF038104 family lipoprotein n=1 Tax=Uliginosibacterium gangwonense TaxID=392736 RepID=UPI00036707B4|nr:NF038104 family lipoprotein [Uliginosibacterium gangwonense]